MSAQTLNHKGLWAVVVAGAMLMAGVPVFAQSQPAPSTSQQQQKPQQQQVPEAGGPQGDIGPYSVPKKKEEPPPERVKPPKNPPEIGEFSITKDVPLVNVDVMVTTKDGQFIPGLKKDNFKVYEDGVAQQVSNFTLNKEAPITAVLLVEFANNSYYFMMDTLNASYAFAQQLKPQDWIGVVYFDMRPHILTDFTQDKRQVYAALGQLRIPGFSETNIFDALYDTIDRLDGVEGHKYIVLVASGRDTFSRITYDTILKKVKSSKDITIYPIATGYAMRDYIERAAGMGSFGATLANMDFLQADNEMRTFAKMTGGTAFFPRFEAEFPEIFRMIGTAIRNEYQLAYHPTNSKLDGTYRKLKVEVIDPATGKPLEVRDQKNKQVKYNVIAREGYTARHQVD